MKIENIKICGFKCFDTEQNITFDDMTCFVGTNSSGKTSALEALCRMFGDTTELRTIKKSDFFIDSTIDNSEIKERHLYIDVKFSFPDIVEDNEYDEIPLTFRYMSIDSTNGKCFCRIRLEASWIDNNTTDGIIDSQLYWIKTNDSTPKDEDKEKVRADERSYIRVFYIPAVRNPESQIKNITGSVIKKLFDSIQWDKKFENTITQNADNLKQSFQAENGIKEVQRVLKTYWNEYSGKNKYNEIILSPIETKIESILKQIKAYFSPGETESYDSTDNLSDGNKSLFYFTLLNTLFEIENEVSLGKNKAFSKDLLQKPLLTIFSIEEPENHLAPHYLGKIIRIFRDMNDLGTQTIITSHSPSILKRISPEEIRYFRMDSHFKSVVKKLTLPEDKLEEAKYVKRAVRAYPELYFSKLIILGEGDSEEFLIPKLAEIYGINLDESFVSFVPLAGRFVHHYWKLLNDLQINFITLVDLDKGRYTGGISKIKYIEGQLEKINELKDEEKNYLENADVSLEEKINFLKTKKVFFSYPIDLDFYMLENFFTEYTKLLPGETAPSIPEVTATDYLVECQKAVAATLKKKNYYDIDISKIDGRIEYYFWYNFLFLTRGKPISHINGLSNISETSLIEKETFKDLFNKVKEFIS